MKIIKIEAMPNGAHDNQQSASIVTVPDGWAVVPEEMDTPNFPFGDIEVETIDGVPTVTSWTAGTLPEPEPVEEQTDTVSARLDNMEQTLDIIMGVKA